MKTTAGSDSFLLAAADPRTESVRLARLALEVDELADRLERGYWSDGEALLLTPGLAYLRLAYDRIDQVVYEAVERIDDRPRLDRLREAT